MKLQACGYFRQDAGGGGGNKKLIIDFEWLLMVLRSIRGLSMHHVPQQRTQQGRRNQGAKNPPPPAQKSWEAEPPWYTAELTIKF